MREFTELPENERTTEKLFEIFSQDPLLFNMLTKDGKLDESQLGLFLIVEGYGVDRKGNYEIGYGTDGKFIGSNFVENARDYQDHVGKYVTKLNKKVPYIDFNGSDRIYKANFFIPLSFDELQSITAYGDNVRISTGYNMAEDSQILYKMLNSGSTSPANL